MQIGRCERGGGCRRDELTANRRGANRFEIQTAAVIEDLQHDLRPLVEGADAHGRSRLLAACGANGFRFNPVIDGVPHEMQQRIEQPVDDRLVELHRLPFESQVNLLADLFGHGTHRATQA